MNQNRVQESIISVMALTLLPSNIGWGSNPRPSDCEPSALLLDHSFCSKYLNICTLPKSKDIQKFCLQTYIKIWQKFMLGGDLIDVCVKQGSQTKLSSKSKTYILLAKQYKPFNMITLSQTKSDHNNQMMTITD